MRAISEKGYLPLFLLLSVPFRSNAQKEEKSEPSDRLRIPGCHSLKDYHEALIAPTEAGEWPSCYCDNATVDISRETGGVQITCDSLFGKIPNVKESIRAVRRDGRSIWNGHFNSYKFGNDEIFPPNYWKDLGAEIKELVISGCLGDQHDEELEVKFHADSFAGLEATLETLKIKFCSFVEFPHAIRKLVNLKYLELSFALSIEEMPNGAFRGLKKLQSLDLKGIRISKWEERVFEGLNSLQTLDLGSYDFDEKMFSSLNEATGKTLEVLKISDMRGLNALVGTPFSNMTALKVLRISASSLQNVSKSAFMGLENLEVLDLWANEVATIEADAFAPLKNLETLDLSGNFLADLTALPLTGLERLESLNLGLNKISEISANAFKGLENLKKLDLGRNFELSQIRAMAFTDLTRLQTLSMNHSKINSIDDEVFKPLENLLSLDLSQSALSSIQENAFLNNRQLRQLLLNNANLSTLSAAILEPLGHLEILDISANPWICDERLKILKQTLLKRLSRGTTTGRPFAIHNNYFAQCHAPLSLKGTPIMLVPDNRFKKLYSERGSKLNDSAKPYYLERMLSPLFRVVVQLMNKFP